MIFVGYEKVSKAYRAYDPVAGTVHVTRNVIFDESAQWDWSGGDETSTGVDHGGEFIVQNRTVPGQEASLWRTWAHQRHHLVPWSREHPL